MHAPTRSTEYLSVTAWRFWSFFFHGTTKRHRSYEIRPHQISIVHERTQRNSMSKYMALARDTVVAERQRQYEAKLKMDFGNLFFRVSVFDFFSSLTPSVSKEEL